MYEYIIGTLTQIKPTYIVVESNGHGYRILSPTPYHWSNQLGQKITVYVEMIVREDAMTLYGFPSEKIKDFFNMLLKVSGIGPKNASSIIAADDYQGFINAIDHSDHKYLMKFPGVGKKTASQIILDLSGELVHLTDEASQPVTKANLYYEDVIAALEGLGYSKREINKISNDLKNSKFKSAEEGLSYAFSLLLKK